MKRPFTLSRSVASSSLALCIALASSTTLAQLGPQDMPGTEGADTVETPDEPELVIEVTPSEHQVPVLLISPATAADEALADALREEIQFTGLFITPSVRSLGLQAGLPDTARWPGLTTAAVVVGRSTRGSSFPAVTSATHHRSMKDVVRKRELVEYPGSEPMTVPVMADAIIEDVMGIRSHMSGRLVFTDASTRGERSVRVTSPNGKRGRRISGFGSLARGADFGKTGEVYYAAEDMSGKLQLFKEGQATPLEVNVPGYVQSVAFSPEGNFVALSMGQGNRVQTWLGSSLDQVSELPLSEGMSSLSPSLDDQGRVAWVKGPEQGPFSLFVGDKQVTPAGVWAAMPQFCSTMVEDRVVYMVRTGRRWDVRLTSLTSGATRTVATNAMSPVCSPDGRTVAFYSPGRSGKGPGVYLVSDVGGRSRKAWDGQAAGLRWRRGEKLPVRVEERLQPPQLESAEPPVEPDAENAADTDDGANPY